MKTIKNTLRITILLAFLVCVFSVCVSASDYDDLTYVISNGKVTITGSSERYPFYISIPSEINGYPVTSIGKGAFSNSDTLRRVVIPESVTSIGDSAFASTRLESIKIPSGVTSIGDHVFNNCDSLTSIEIPDGVTKIGDYAFYGCDNLTSVAMTNSVKLIGYDAFRECDSLEYVYYLGSNNDWKNIYIDGVYSPILYANLKLINNYINIYYSANGGTGAPESQIKSYGTNLTLSSVVPVREGYNFLGWSKSSTATSASYSAGSKHSDLGYYSFTLYAVWSKKTYSVTYYANGGTGAPESQIKSYGTNLTLSSVVPVRDGYDFLGWSTASNGSVEYSPGETYSVNEHLDLYAVWSEKTYSVTYDANGGTGAPESQIKSYGTNLTFSNVVPVREGYDFLAWSTNRNPNGETTKKTLSVSCLESAHNYPINTNQSWTISSSGANSIELTFDSRTKFESDYDFFYVYDRNNTQVGKYSGTELAGKTITVQGDKVTLTLTSDIYIDEWGFKVTSAYAVGDDIYELGDSCTIDSDVTYYAVWSEKTYSVTYNANGGSNAPSSQTKKHFDNLVLTSSIPERTGYTFKGWATTPEGQVVYNPGDTCTQNEALSFYAVWEAEKYVVSYDANGGTGAPESQIKSYGTNLTLSSVVPVREGYNFLGWSTSSTTTSSSYSAGSTYTDIGYVDVTLYAVWSEKTYSVTYNANGGSNTPSSQTKYHFNNLALTTELPTRTGYTFLGWSTTPDCKVEYISGDTYTKNIDLVLYAKWISNDSIYFEGASSAATGRNIQYDVLFSSGGNLDYLISTIKYPKYFSVKEIVNKDFVDNTIDSEYSDDAYNYITIISTYSYDGKRTEQYKGYTPYEIVFEVSKNCPSGTYSLTFGEDTVAIGDADYSLITAGIDIFILETFTIYGDDEISGDAQYTVRGVNSPVVPVVWSVDDENVATISEDGVLTPITNGTVVITATYTENDTIFATKTVTVKDNDVTAIDIIGSDTVYDGEKYYAKIYPENLNSKKVNWSVDNSEVATITEDGVLTAVSAGTVTVRATIDDAKAFYEEMTVTIPSVNTVIDSLSTDIGTWDKAFVPYERNYTVVVPANTASIAVTGSFTGGSLKCNGTTMLNGRARTITLDSDVTTLTLSRANVEGKNDSSYTVTVVRSIPYITANVSVLNGKYHFEVDTVALPEGIDEATIILAVYDEHGVYSSMQTKSITSEDTTAQFDIETNEICSYQVMLFENVDLMKPVCQSVKDNI